MKKLIFALFIGSLIANCTTSKKVVVETPKSVEEVKRVPPVPWFQDIDHNIAVGDPILFYNEYRIVVKGKIPITLREYKDGKLVSKDSSIVFDYSIPALTTGKIVKVVSKGGKPVSFAVSFNEGDDKNYTHTFTVDLANKTFVMAAEITLSINGADYKEKSAIEGLGNGLCHLLYYPEHSGGESKVGEPASGVAPVIGTKPIK